MRLFQNSGVYPAYRELFGHRHARISTFSERITAFLNDRYGACHYLKPVLDGAPEAFFTNGDDEILQRMWARENGLPDTAQLDEILLAQIEHHRTEVFYNLDPMRYGSDFVRRLPGCVRKNFAWRAAPSPGADFAAYDAVLCNFPAILEDYRRQGWRGVAFNPAHDPEMDAYTANRERPIDVLFIGGYSRHHRRRGELLETVAALRERFRIVFHLDRSRLTRLAETPLGLVVPPLRAHRRPCNVRKVSRQPVFGRELYSACSQAKIVLNGHIDMAGNERGNMRCFEATGCGALLLSDAGDYGEGFVPGVSMITWREPADAVREIAAALAEPERLNRVATAGYDQVRQVYAKDVQWARFQALAS